MKENKLYRITGNRCTGKTSRLILLAKEQNGIIVSISPDYVKSLAHKYDISNIDVISYSEYNEMLMGKRSSIDYDRPIFIDELEIFLQLYLDKNIQGYSISIED